MSVRTCQSELWTLACATVGGVIFLGFIACSSRQFGSEQGSVDDRRGGAVGALAESACTEREAVDQDGGIRDEEEHILQLVAGGEHYCTLRASGSVECWGNNGFGQLGYRSSGCGKQVCSTSRRRVEGLDDVVEIAAGGNNACARKPDGSVLCWGAAYSGQLGDSSVERCGDPLNGTECSHQPVRVFADVGVRTLALGRNHICVLLHDGSLRCWGANTQGQLGAQTKGRCRSFPGADAYDCSKQPHLVAGLESVAHVAASAQTTCAVTQGGEVACWGAGAWGQLGYRPSKICGMGLCSHEPRVVSGLKGVSGIASGGRSTCVWKNDGTAWCWGENSSGELGYRAADKCGQPDHELWACSFTPKRVRILKNVVAIETVFGNSCALLSDGRVACWGDSEYGELVVEGQDDCGVEDTQPCSRSPMTIRELPCVTKIAIGNTSACALTQESEVYCWGRNELGQLGQGDRDERPGVVVRVE